MLSFLSSVALDPCLSFCPCPFYFWPLNCLRFMDFHYSFGILKCVLFPSTHLPKGDDCLNYSIWTTCESEETRKPPKKNTYGSGLGSWTSPPLPPNNIVLGKWKWYICHNEWLLDWKLFSVKWTVFSWYSLTKIKKRNYTS